MATQVQEIFAKLLGQSGSAHIFPLLTIGHAPGVQAQLDCPFPAWHQDVLNWYWWKEDFLWDAFDIDEHPLDIYDASASGTPTKALKADGTGGQFEFTLAATSEDETLGFTMGDNLYINSARPFLAVFRVKVGHTMAANERIVIGLASDVSSGANPPTLDNLTRNLWFRLEADFDLLTELDDNSTDTDDQDTGFDVVEDTWYTYVILKGYDGRVYYCLLNNNGQSFQMLDDLDGSSLSGNLQPVVLIQKSSGTTQPQVFIDWLGFAGPREN